MKLAVRLIAPCGMNCGICYAHLREKDRCPGCRVLTATNYVSIARCRIRNCAAIKGGDVHYCFECTDYPCAILKRMDKRYRTRYHMSEIENLENIRKNGVRKFISGEKARWTCPKCGGTICVHKGICSSCGRKREIQRGGI